MEAEIGVLCLQPRDTKGFGRDQKFRRLRRVFGEHGPADTLLLAPWPPGRGEKAFLLLETPSVWALFLQPWEALTGWTVVSDPHALRAT